MPGLVDTHIHAPQYVNSGVGYDRQLLEWLDIYTFPTEAKFKDIEVAKDVYPKVVVCHYYKLATWQVYYQGRSEDFQKGFPYSHVRKFCDHAHTL